MKEQISIIIDIEYGSTWQKEATPEIYELVMKALKINFENRHKKNKLDYTMFKTVTDKNQGGNKQ